MKQTVTIRRTETAVITLDVMQPLTRETLTKLLNTDRPLGSPAIGQIVSHVTPEWEVTKAEPGCECTPQVKSKAWRK